MWYHVIGSTLALCSTFLIQKKLLAVNKINDSQIFFFLFQGNPATSEHRVLCNKQNFIYGINANRLSIFRNFICHTMGALLEIICPRIFLIEEDLAPCPCTSKYPLF